MAEGRKWVPVSSLLRVQLFNAILGRGGKFPKAWLLQHIDFPAIQNECRLQIKQYFNGPCGAIASIQVRSKRLFDIRENFSPSIRTNLLAPRRVIPV